MTKELLQQCQAEFEDYADLLKQFKAPVDSCVGGSMIRANSMADKLKQALAQQDRRCPDCDGTGDVHSPDGQRRGECHCKAQQEQPAKAPVGYFLKTSRQNLCDVYEQVSSEYMNDPDVIALYTHPAPTQPALSADKVSALADAAECDTTIERAQFISGIRTAEIEHGIGDHCRGGAGK